MTESITVPFSASGYRRPILVHLPPSYVATPEHSFPVLYLTDADFHLAVVRAAADHLALNRRMPEMIVVGIPNIIDRFRDLVATTSDSIFTPWTRGKYQSRAVRVHVLKEGEPSPARNGVATLSTACACIRSRAHA